MRINTALQFKVPFHMKDNLANMKIIKKRKIEHANNDVKRQDPANVSAPDLILYTLESGIFKMLVTVGPGPFSLEGRHYRPVV